MELETICRYNLPITTIVLNNGGIGGGFEDWPADQPLPPSALSRTARYEKVCEAFGGQGYYVEDPADLRPDAGQGDLVGPAVSRARADRRASADRKPQEYPLEDVSELSGRGHETERKPLALVTSTGPAVDRSRRSTVTPRRPAARPSIGALRRSGRRGW